MTHPFIAFHEACPTSYHTAKWLQKKFQEKGFLPLSLDGKGSLEKGKSYFYRKEGTFFAFSLPPKEIRSLRFFGAHTDSPALKIKPNPIVEKEGCLFLAVEIYGSPIISSWLDRDLFCAGRIFTADGSEKTVVWKEPKVIIPTLPPHLFTGDRPKEQGTLPHLETQLLALLSLNGTAKNFLDEMAQEKVLSHDLFLLPDSPPSLLLHKKALAASRLDNLASVFAIYEGFKPAEDRINFALFWDHEEIGSRSERGADSSLFSRFLATLLSHLAISPQEAFRLQEESLMLSIDNAHAFHPLYPAHFSENHSPKLGHGIALKESSSLRYATSAKGLSLILPALQKGAIPFQHYVARNDLRGGSTLGPFFAASIGSTTVDLGIPQLSMHSAREIIALDDLAALTSAVTLLCQHE